MRFMASITTALIALVAIMFTTKIVCEALDIVWVLPDQHLTFHPSGHSTSLIRNHFHAADAHARA